MDAIDWLIAHAMYIGFAAVFGLACLGLGYYTAAKDAAEEQSRG